jgi:predicted  nucleic acid-binding Zn-ribbon protein
VSSPIYSEPPQQRSGLATALVTGTMIALLAAVVYLFVQMDHLQTDMAKMKESFSNELTSQKDATSVTSAAHQKRIEDLKDQLEAARTQLKSEAKSMSAEAKLEATAHTDAIAKQIAAEEAQMKQIQVAQAAEIGDVKQSATAANAKIADVSTDVGGVKTNLSATQAELQKTIAGLKSAQGDLGVQSGLIATNAGELAALKALGDRTITDIKLGKTKAPVRFADITLKLVSADKKKNKYTVLVLADDKQTEKKDKSVNEPVQFYTAKGGHIPYELVINQVNKDEIVGYLSTPKVQAPR